MRISNKTLCITPERAESYLTDFKYERQRPINKGSVERYAVQMKAGTFDPGTQINIAAVGQKMFLVNGQHRLAAVVQSGVPIEFAVTTHYCDNDMEVALLYGKLDTQKPRTTVDLIHATGLDTRLDMGRTETRIVGGAIKLLYCGLVDNHVKKASISQETVAGMMQDWATYIDMWDENLTDTPLNMRMRRSAMLAVGYATLRWSPDREWTKSFWRAVSVDDGLRVGNPRKTLSLWIRDNLSGGELGRKASDSYVLHAASCAWNAAVGGRELRQIHVPNEWAPITLAGVWPRKGNRHA